MRCHRTLRMPIWKSQLISHCKSAHLTRLILLSVCFTCTNSWAQQKQHLRLLQTIPMPNVKGRINRMDLDAKGNANVPSYRHSRWLLFWEAEPLVCGSPRKGKRACSGLDLRSRRLVGSASFGGATALERTGVIASIFVSFLACHGTKKYRTR